jgi:uncharacterized protein YhhL (DUF1145 family)
MMRNRGVLAFVWAMLLVTDFVMSFTDPLWIPLAVVVWLMLLYTLMHDKRLS